METIDIDKKISYINIQIGTECFAISVFKVLEIIRYAEVTYVPKASDFVPGIINFRGSIVPVIDMHKRFNMTGTYDAVKMIVVVDIKKNDKNVLLGLLVDQVTDVLEFEFKSIRSVPDLGIKFNPDFIDGFIEHKDGFIMVLNTDRVLNLKELSEVSLVTDSE